MVRGGRGGDTDRRPATGSRKGEILSESLKGAIVQVASKGTSRKIGKGSGKRS